MLLEREEREEREDGGHEVGMEVVMRKGEGD